MKWFHLLALCVVGVRAELMLLTTKGPLGKEEAGLILPHEHIFTDLRGPEVEGHGQADAKEVSRVMKPLLVAAKEAGVGTLIECTTIGVGRNAPIIADLARESGLNVVVPTGVYGRANFAPKEYAAMSEDALVRWMLTDIMLGIENSRVRAGFIKTAASESDLTTVEEKFLRASARASRQTGVAIASHTTSGKVASVQASILDLMDVPLDRFVWVHAQAESDSKFHVALARRGVWIELDSVGGSEAEDEKILRLIRVLAEAGLKDKILISQDAGWYNPGQANGGKQRGYTSLIETFLPKMRKAGYDEKFIRQLTRENPFRAFGIEMSR